MRNNTGIAVLILLLLSGCMSGLKGDSYTREDARTPQRVEFAVVEAVRPVVIEGSSSQIGTAVGAIVGGLAGSGVGRGRGSAISGTLAATAGGVLGNLAEEKTTRKQALEITLRKNNGQLLSIVQETDPDQLDEFKVGDKVRILRLKGVYRVAR